MKTALYYLKEAKFTSLLQTSQLLSEKDEHIEQLQDRVKTLEQRGHNEALSGDERMQALEQEVCVS